MEKRRYEPKAIDTRAVEIPKELEALTEALARNTHEVWGASRLARGWKWGPVRDDILKHHPNLVSYEELTDEEKDYDRHTSMETIKVILSLGYEITPRNDREGF